MNNGVPATRMLFYHEFIRNVHIEDIGSSAANDSKVRFADF